MPNIPDEFLSDLPRGVDVAACAVTTYGALRGGHIVDARGAFATISDDAPAILLRGWCADDGNARVNFPAAGSSEEAAQAYVDGGEWGGSSKTSWVDVSAWREAYAWDAEDHEAILLRVDCEEHLIAIDPDEPDCDRESHDWRSPHEVLGGLTENPGVWGNGGGVIIQEVCVRCGAYRVTDTWAQEPTTGQQGLESVEYRAADEASLAWVRSCIRGRVLDLVDAHGSDAVEDAVCDIQVAESAEVDSDGGVEADDRYVDDSELPELVGHWKGA